jgi:hypothetical protein
MTGERRHRVVLSVGVAEGEEVGMAHEEGEGGERESYEKETEEGERDRPLWWKLLGIRTEGWETGRGYKYGGSSRVGVGFGPGLDR